eukprot:TRINITY_DN4834_c1_g1_i2.p1 TRINITY_DN4834_c1_g1~~TRINITY_DN4834_c1_g1_i2.p1  ORF type:complete len:1090 (+),score=171.84 TRINITY_DN4834_c1_g1_i2:68-3337(+)
MRCCIPAKVFILVSAVASTVVSLTGGFLIFRQTLSILTDTVEDLSKSDGRSLLSQLQKTLDDAERLANTFAMRSSPPLPTDRGNESLLDVYAYAYPSVARSVGAAIATHPTVVSISVLMDNPAWPFNDTMLWVVGSRWQRTGADGKPETVLRLGGWAPGDPLCQGPQVGSLSAISGPCLHVSEVNASLIPVTQRTPVSSNHARYLNVRAMEKPGWKPPQLTTQDPASLTTVEIPTVSLSLDRPLLGHELKPGLDVDVLIRVQTSTRQWQTLLRSMSQNSNAHIAIVLPPPDTVVEETCEDNEDELLRVTSGFPGCALFTGMFGTCNVTEEHDVIRLLSSAGYSASTLLRTFDFCRATCCALDNITLDRCPRCVTNITSPQGAEPSGFGVYTQPVVASSDFENNYRVDDECTFVRNHSESTGAGSWDACRLHLGLLPKAVREAYSEFKNRGLADGFILGDIPSGKYFMRFGTIRATTMTVETLWVKSHSVVIEEVVSALLLLVFFIAGVLAVDLAVAVVEILMLARPLGILEKDMTQVASMRLDFKWQDRDSCLTEVKAMQDAFHVMVQNLQHYKQFLPRAVLETAACDTGREVEAPVGHVAICFTDIVGSSRLWNAGPDAMNMSIELHNEVMREHLIRQAGYEVKTIGDAFMVSFSSAKAGAAFATGVQHALVQQQWPVSAELERASPFWRRYKDSDQNLVWHGLAIRVGVAVGKVTVEVNPVTNRVDYRGPAVMRAAYLERMAPAGGAVLSGACAAELKQPNLVLRPLKHLEQEGDVPVLACEQTLRNRHTVEEADVTAEAAHFPAPRASVAMSVSTMDPLDRRGSRAAGQRPSHTDTHSEISDARSMHSGESLSSCRSAGAVPTAFNAGTKRLSATKGACAVLLSSTSETAGFADTVTQLMICVARSHGNVGCLVGQSLHASWNVAAPCPMFQDAPFNLTSVLWGKQNLSIGTGIGAVLHGEVRALRQRFYTISGVAASAAPLLASTALQVGKFALVCWWPSTHVRRERCRLVDTWGFTSGGKRCVLSVEEILEDGEVNTDTPLDALTRADGRVFRIVAPFADPRSVEDAFSEASSQAGVPQGEFAS